MYLRLGDRGRGEHERRVGAVRRAHPPQPPQHLRHVGAEHSSVVVALVDHDIAQGAEERRPAVVRGQQGTVQHVGVRQHVLGVVAGPLPLLARAVAVVGGHPEVESQRLQPGQLVLGQRLGRAEVEGRGSPLPPRTAGVPDGRQGGQLVAEGLARSGAGGHHDVPARVGGLGGVDLVPPQGVDAASLERRPDVVGHPERPGCLDRGPGGQHLEVGQPLLAAGHGGQPRHDVAQRDAGDGLGGHAAILPSGSDIRVRARVSPDAARGPRAFAALAFALVPSVLKPWGRTRWARSRDRV